MPAQVGCAVGLRAQLCEGSLPLALGKCEASLEVVPFGGGSRQLDLDRCQVQTELCGILRGGFRRFRGRSCVFVRCRGLLVLDLGAQVIHGLVEVGAAFRGGGGEHRFDLAVDALADSLVVGADGLAVELLRVRFHDRSMDELGLTRKGYGRSG